MFEKARDECLAAIDILLPVKQARGSNFSTTAWYTSFLPSALSYFCSL